MENLQELYEKNYKSLCKVAHSWEIKGANHNMDFDDLMSICNIGFMDAVESFDSTRGAKFNTYVTTVANNTVSKHFKKLNAIKRNPEYGFIYIDEEVQDELPLAETISNNEDMCMDVCEKDLIERVMEVARPIKRAEEILTLKMQGYTISEIGRLLGVSREVVAATFWRFKNKLREKGIIKVS